MEKTKSTYGNQSKKNLERKTYHEKYMQSPPSGLLKDLKNQENTCQKSLKINNPKGYINLAKSDSNESSDSVDDEIQTKKVSFASHVSIKHGSKKLIEMIEETDEDPDQKFGNTAKIVPVLKKNKSHEQNVQVTNQKNIRDKYRTPADMKIKTVQNNLKNKAKITTSGKSMIQTTEKREMNRKAWKQNRIKNQHKKVNTKLAEGKLNESVNKTKECLNEMKENKSKNIIKNLKVSTRQH